MSTRYMPRIHVKKNTSNLLLFSIIGRCLVLLNALNFIFFFFYLLGNYQFFLDSTQLFLLRCLDFTILLTGLSGFYYLIVLLIMTLRNKKLYLIRFVLTLLSLIGSVALYLWLKFMFSWFHF